MRQGANNDRLSAKSGCSGIQSTWPLRLLVTLTPTQSVVCCELQTRRTQQPTHGINVLAPVSIRIAPLARPTLARRTTSCHKPHRCVDSAKLRSRVLIHYLSISKWMKQTKKFNSEFKTVNLVRENFSRLYKHFTAYFSHYIYHYVVHIFINIEWNPFMHKSKKVFLVFHHYCSCIAWSTAILVIVFTVFTDI